MPAFLTDRQWLAVLLAVFMAVALSACGGGGGTTQMPGPMPPDPPMPTAYEQAMTAIAEAETAEAAQAAYDAVKGDVTAAQGEMLQAAVDARAGVLAKMAREAEQKQALMDAADMIDTSDLSTQALVDAARTAIAGLRQAIADAEDVDDTSMYQTMLDNAVDAVDMAQGGIDTATRRMNQMTALSGASTTLQAALAALSGATPTQALLDDANNALTALNNAITAGADLTDTEKAPYQHEADNAAAPIETAQTAFDEAEDEAEKARLAAMAVTASQLYTGIGTDPLLSTARSAAYGTGDNAADIAVTIDGGTPVNLSEDDEAMVDARHGWTGMMFMADPEGDTNTYEAVVYSDVDDPMVTAGLKFGSATDNDDYQYTLDAEANTELTMDDTNADADWEERVASPSFDQNAGIKEFELPADETRLMVAGSYHGVSGNYYCTPAASSTCAVQVVDDGFSLGGTADADNAFTAAGGSWTFKASNNDAQLMETSAPDVTYASYGWWIQKNEDGEPVAVSAFHAYRGTDTPAVAIAELRGTATYIGGAAGKYSLRGDTGGMNDAGHFTADVTLEATFAADHTIEGTISNFMGADDMARDWSVKLNETDISDAGVIDGLGGDANDEQVGTVWTLGGTEGDTVGQWSGNLREQGADGVPAVATGTFYSTFGQNGNDGRMVGAFGASEQE